MSGGSFDYVCFKDFSQLVNGEGIHSLLELVDFMEHTFPHETATVESRAMYEWVRKLARHLENDPPELTALQKVWKAVEWWKSGDYGKDAVIEELRAFEVQKLGIDLSGNG